MTHGTDLDRLLDAWVSTQRLDEAEADALRRAIVAEPRGPAPSWWTEFGARMGDVIVDATRASTVALRATGWVPQPQTT